MQRREIKSVQYGWQFGIQGREGRVRRSRFAKRPEGSEGMKHGVSWGKCYKGRLKNKVKDLSRKHTWNVQQAATKLMRLDESEKRRGVEDEVKKVLGGQHSRDFKQVTERI